MLQLFAAIILLFSLTPASAGFIWGANGHPLLSYPGVPIENQFQYLKNLGLKSYRIDISGTDAIPKLKRIVAKAKRYGITILPVITPGDIDLDKDSSQVLYDKARHLAETLGSAFKSDIRTWELGNEMENYAIIQPCEMRDDGTQYPCDWGPAGGMTPLEYYGPRWKKVSAVLKGLSEGMNVVDPGIRKAIGTAGWGHLGAFERMQQDGINWDITVWHSYSENAEDSYAALSKYGKPIWVTELNNPFGSQKSEQEQADWLEKTIGRLQSYEKKYNVEAAFIYELMDETYWAPDHEAYMGLVRLIKTPEGGWRPGEPKPAYFAVRNSLRGNVPLPVPPKDCKTGTGGNALPSQKSPVTYAYCLVFGEYPEAMASAIWTAVIREKDTDIRDLVTDLIRSNKFQAKYMLIGETDENYVRFLYELLLDRPADPGGLKSYLDGLSSGQMTRPGVAQRIIQSAEFLDRHRPMFSPDIQSNALSLQPG